MTWSATADFRTKHDLGCPPPDPAEHPARKDGETALTPADLAAIRSILEEHREPDRRLVPRTPTALATGLAVWGLALYGLWALLG